MRSTTKELVAGAIVLALAAAAFTTIALPAIRSPDRAIRDFSIDYAAARAWRDGGDPFASTSANVTRYVAPRTIDEPEWHTPLYVMLFLPLSYLPYRGAAAAWALLSIAAVILAGVILARGLGYASAWGALGGGVALFMPPLVSDLGHGQMNSILVLLLVLAWRYLRDARIGGALALGAAAAIKIFPAVAILALIRRERRDGVRAILSAAAFTVVGVLVMGHIGSWFDAASHISGGYATRPDNFSVTAVLARWLGTAPAMALMGVAAAAFLLVQQRDFWVGALVALAAWPVVWPHYLACAVPWVAIAIIKTDGRLRVAAAAVGALFAIATLPGPWWTATVGSRPGLWWLAPAATLLAIGISVQAAGRLNPSRDDGALVAA
ncbi:MAG: glycosyltransferase family 87 protein [Actinomycetota bacterium]